MNDTNVIYDRFYQYLIDGSIKDMSEKEFGDLIGGMLKIYSDRIQDCISDVRSAGIPLVVSVLRKYADALEKVSYLPPEISNYIDKLFEIQVQSNNNEEC